MGKIPGWTMVGRIEGKWGLGGIIPGGPEIGNIPPGWVGPDGYIPPPGGTVPV